jgi:hypothetical protein
VACGEALKMRAFVCQPMSRHGMAEQLYASRIVKESQWAKQRSLKTGRILFVYKEETIYLSIYIYLYIQEEKIERATNATHKLNAHLIE